MEIITVGDLPASVRGSIEESLLQLMVDGLNARALRVAPCLAGNGEDDPDPSLLAEAKLILISVIKRWSEAGSGALSSEQRGPMSVTVDTRQRSGWNLRPSDISDLQDLCKESSASDGKAFSVDVGPTATAIHLPWCSLLMGATYCSCGSSINGYAGPLYEGGEIS